MLRQTNQEHCLQMTQMMAIKYANDTVRQMLKLRVKALEQKLSGPRMIDDEEFKAVKNVPQYYRPVVTEPPSDGSGENYDNFSL